MCRNIIPYFTALFTTLQSLCLFFFNFKGLKRLTNTTIFICSLIILTDPAKIVTRPEDQVVWVGQQVTLFCNATGNPVPNITYSIVGENGTVGSGETLIINSSRTAYVKMYTCKATNGIGSSATANATVTVLGKWLLFFFFSR